MTSATGSGAAHLYASDSAFARARDGYWMKHDQQHMPASAIDPGTYTDWLDHIWAAAVCTHPIRLGGQVHR